MTREEAKLLLIRPTVSSNVMSEIKAREIEAYNMAIEALSEPINCVKCPHYYETEEDGGVEGHCKMDTAHQDLVSREEVLMKMSAPLAGECSPWGYWRLEDEIKAIPTARPTGEWIDVNGDGSLWRCDQCKDIACCKGNFCPNCGAVMRKGNQK